MTSKPLISTSGFRRREILELLGAVGILQLPGCTTLPAAPKPPPTGAASTTIDIHCHIFNANDLPIDGFVQDVVLADDKSWAIATGPLIELVSLVMKSDAITAADELRQIQAGQAATVKSFRATYHPSLAPATPVAASVLPQTDDDLVRAKVIDAVNKLRQPASTAPNHAAPLIERALPASSENEQALRSLAARGKPQAHAHALTPEAQSAAPAPPTAEEVAEGVVSTDDQIHGIFYMAALMTRPRAELADRLATLPAAGAGEISFFAPAMIDYSYWLADMNVTPLPLQIAVMSAIAALPNQPHAVHPWASFCPWRQIAEEALIAANQPIVDIDGSARTKTQLELVQDAVMNRGFVGVKLYPVMGFRPYGNDGAADAAAYPAALQKIPGWGQKLDAAMAKLFDWCVAEDVPIMAHCSYSQYPNSAAGLRGAPQAWQPVFAKWKMLRVNLGHLGGFWDLVTSSGGTPNGWTGALVPMLASQPMLYADLADYDAVLDRPNVTGEAELDSQTLAALDALLVQSPAAKAKLMYGTDWVMLSRSLGVEQYYPDMKLRIPADLHLTPAETRGFLGFNAADFLGIAKDANRNKPKTRQRLEQFRASAKLDTAILGRWDRPS